MAKRVDMRLKLSPKQKSFIEKCVELGMYPDAVAHIENMYERLHAPRTDAEVVALASASIKKNRKARLFDDSLGEELLRFAREEADRSRKPREPRRRSA